MFKSEKARECLKKVVGWKNHYDTNEIPNLDPKLNESESGEFYQEKHPAMRLDLIKATLPNNRNLEDYLNEVEDASITELLNDLYVDKELAETSKELIANDVISNSRGWMNNTIQNESRFVGIQFTPRFSIGLKATINRLALQLTDAQTGLELYLYHTHKAKVLKKIEYTTTQGGQFNWIGLEDLDMIADDADLSGGSFILGYYQDELTGQAIQYDKLNWNTGFCSSCDGGRNQARYTSLQKYLDMRSFYVPSAGISNDADDIFDLEQMIESPRNNWGFNFNISIKCDLTNFWCDNRLTLKNALSLKVVLKILKDISYSQQINHVEEQLKMMILNDLDGDKHTDIVTIPMQYSRARKAIKLNHSSINSICLPCAKKSRVSYGTM